MDQTRASPFLDGELPIRVDMGTLGGSHRVPVTLPHIDPDRNVSPYVLGCGIDSRGHSTPPLGSVPGSDPYRGATSTPPDPDRDSATSGPIIKLDPRIYIRFGIIWIFFSR